MRIFLISPKILVPSPAEYPFRWILFVMPFSPVCNLFIGKGACKVSMHKARAKSVEMTMRINQSGIDKPALKIKV